MPHFQVSFETRKRSFMSFSIYMTVSLSRLDLRIGMCQIFIKVVTSNKSNILIMNKLITIYNFDPKLKICEIWPQN